MIAILKLTLVIIPRMKEIDKEISTKKLLNTVRRNNDTNAPQSQVHLIFAQLQEIDGCVQCYRRESWNEYEIRRYTVNYIIHSIEAIPWRRTYPKNSSSSKLINIQHYCWHLTAATIQMLEVKTWSLNDSSKLIRISNQDTNTTTKDSLTYEPIRRITLWTLKGATKT